MNRHLTCRLLLLLPALWPFLGCASWRPPAGPVSAPAPAAAAPPAGEPAARGKGELPPEQAAEVCLATARALEKEEGHEALAVLEYERARQANPRLDQVSWRLAVLHDRLGEHAQAEAEYRKALQAHPKDADLLNDLGYYHYKRGHWDEAEKVLRQALAVNGGHERAWVNLGLVLAEQQRDGESYEAFAKAVSPAEAHYNVGMILARHGKVNQARKALGDALALQPDLKPAQLALAALDHPPSAAFPQPQARGSSPGHRPGAVPLDPS